MERNALWPPEREPLDGHELGKIYDTFAALALERGQKRAIPESAPLAGYPLPAEYYYPLTKDVIDRALSSWQDHIEVMAEGSYVLYTTPHIYDAMEGEDCVSSVVDIVVKGRLKGSSVDVETSFRIEIGDFSGRTLRFDGEFIQNHTRGGRYVPSDEVVLTEDGVTHVEPESRRMLERQDLGPIERLASEMGIS